MSFQVGDRVMTESGAGVVTELGRTRPGSRLASVRVHLDNEQSSRQDWWWGVNHLIAIGYAEVFDL